MVISPPFGRSRGLIKYAQCTSSRAGSVMPKRFCLMLNLFPLSAHLLAQVADVTFGSGKTAAVVGEPTLKVRRRLNLFWPFTPHPTSPQGRRETTDCHLPLNSFPCSFFARSIAISPPLAFKRRQQPPFPIQPHAGREAPCVLAENKEVYQEAGCKLLGSMDTRDIFPSRHTPPDSLQRRRIRRIRGLPTFRKGFGSPLRVFRNFPYFEKFEYNERS